MNTILTDDERPKLPPTNAVRFNLFSAQDMEAYADAREAAVLAKLARQEPVAHFGSAYVNENGVHVTTVLGPVAIPQDAKLYTRPAPQQADRQRVTANKANNEFSRVIQHAITLGSEAAQFLRCWNEGSWGGCREFDFEPALPYEIEEQADRQRVPDGWKLVPIEPTDRMCKAAADAWLDCHSKMVLNKAGAAAKAAIAAAPEAPAQADHFEQHLDMVPAQHREPSPTAGMNMAQRILHVGGRTNAAGYVEFGSVQAVDALVRHVLRDLPDAPPAHGNHFADDRKMVEASAVDERDRKDAERYRWLREQMLGVDFDWDESGKTALCFEMPDGCSFAADCDQVIDDASAALAQKGGR